MLAAFATLVFLTALWFIGMTALQTLGESGGKVLAALQGRSLLAATPEVKPVTMRFSQRGRPQRALHARPQWRAAA